MDLEDQLEDLKQRKQDLQKSLGQRKKEFVALQREKKRTLENQIRRAQYRISARERKQRTRQLILIGSVVKNQADRDSRTRLWLQHALDEALERPQDRALFDLPPNKEHEKGHLSTPPGPTAAAPRRSAPRMASAPPENRWLGLHLPRRHVRAVPRSRRRTHHRAVKRRPVLDHHRNCCPGPEQRTGYRLRLRTSGVISRILIPSDGVSSWPPGRCVAVGRWIGDDPLACQSPRPFLGRVRRAGDELTHRLGEFGGSVSRNLGTDAAAPTLVPTVRLSCLVSKSWFFNSPRRSYYL